MWLLVRLFLRVMFLMFLSLSQFAIADNEQGSLDLMWKEQAGSDVIDEQREGKAESSASKRRITQQVLSVLNSGAGAAVISAPLCSLKSFEQSDFVINGGGWPHIGPFKRLQDRSDELEDAQKNRIKLSLSNDKITEAELNLVRQPGESILSLKMAADFFLEALGAKPNKISQFNDQLEKQKNLITERSLTSPVNLSAGQYFVLIQADANGSTTDKPANLVIRVNNKDASEEAIKQHSREVSTVSQPASSSDSDISKSDKRSVAVLRKTDSEATPPNKVPSPTQETQSEKSPAIVEMRQQFEDVIKNWQQIKKVAVKQRQIDDLKQVLAGKALDKQSDAIKWLAANHKYYEMSPKGVTVYHYKELNPGQKFAVFAKVQEESKLIDEATKQVLKDTRDTYNVNYTVERIGDRWLITDSAIATAGHSSPKPSSNKPNR